MKDIGDTEAEDVRRHGSTTSSFNGPVHDAPRITRRVRGQKSGVEGGGAGHPEDLDHRPSNRKDVPVDFYAVQTRLQAGKYSSIVCTAFLLLGFVAVINSL